MLEIEIAYGLADKQQLYRLQVPENTQARQAVLQHAHMILRDFPHANVHAPIGIFGKMVKDDAVLRNHDRIELYRPLLADPKDARRKRVQNKQEHS